MTLKNITPAALLALENGDFKNFMVAASPGGIEVQEAQGQKDFVSSETLPKELLNGTTREMLESLGIVFGNDVDELFVEVQLPEGWEIIATEHSMWSDLFDEKGCIRAQIFYKAAFYDRRAHLHLVCRFAHCYRPEDNYETVQTFQDRDAGIWFGVVLDGKGVVYKTSPMQNPTYTQKDVLSGLARMWLDKHYPDWENPLAYWD